MSRYAATRAVGAGVAAVLVGAAVATTVPDLLRTAHRESVELPAGVETVTVQSSGSGDVRVVEGQGVVTAELSYSYTRPELLVTDLGDGQAAVRMVSCNAWCSTDLQLDLPSGVGVQVDTVFGDVDISSSGPVTVRGTGSSVRIDGAPTSIQAHTTLGDITVAPELAIPDITLRSTLGDVSAQLPGGTAYLVDVRTNLGEPTVLVDRSATSPHRVDVTTSLGDIRIENQ